MRPKRSADPVKAAHQLYLEIIGEGPRPAHAGGHPGRRRRSPWRG